MGEHLRTVNAPPFERIVGEFVKLVPTDFCCHKVFHSAFFNKLGNGGGIAENIGEPHNFVINAEFLTEKAFAHHKLSYEGFAGCHICVRFNPHTALGFPSALFDSLFDFLVNLGVILFNIFVKLSLGGHKSVLGVFIHIFQHRGESATSLFPCLTDSPEPGKVNMGVSHRPAGSLLEFSVKVFIKVF